MTFSNPNQANSVQVTVKRTTSENGEVGLFFGSSFGTFSHAVQSTATASIMNSFVGFEAPADGTNLMILPFALDLQTWTGLLAGTGSDNWKYNPTSKQVTSESDNILEVNLFPQGTGSPGNRGTVNIGVTNNSTATIERQILNGLSPSDLANLPGGQLTLNSQGVLYLDGNPGISAAVKDDLTSIIGQPRIIPIFSTVNGPGNNAVYTIVAFAGVRIMYVNLTGPMSSKCVTIQPANVKTEGGIAGTGQTSYYVHSLPWLVR